MKINFILSILFISVFCVTSAAQEVDFILSEKENEEWLEKVDSYELKVQLEELKNRIVQDTAVYFNYLSGNYESPEQKVGLAKREFSEESKSRPLYLFVYEKESLRLQANPESERIEKLVEEINTDKISKIEVYKGVMARALYGTSGSYGVINIVLNDKASLNRIKEILSNQAGIMNN